MIDEPRLAGPPQVVFSSRRTIQAISPREAARAISRAMVIGGSRLDGFSPIMAPGRPCPQPMAQKPQDPEPLAPEPRAQELQNQQVALVFVYGTLKRGQANHHQLGQALCLGEVTMPGVDLHDLGPFPMAVPGTGAAQGELYRVGAAALADLDRFEGVPRLYQRQQRALADGRIAWIYLGRPRQVRYSPRLPGGRWPAGPSAAPQRSGRWDGKVPHAAGTAPSDSPANSTHLFRLAP